MNMFSPGAMDLKYIYFVIQMLSSKDVNFMGYTYKNFDIVNGHDVPGVGMVFFSYFESINYAYLIYFHINLTLVIISDCHLIMIASTWRKLTMCSLYYLVIYVIQDSV